MLVIGIKRFSGVLALCFLMQVAMAQNVDSVSHGKFKHLGLTSDQKAKINHLRLNLKKEVLPIQNLIGEKEAHLKSLEAAPKADIAAIHKTLDEMYNLKLKMAKLKAGIRQEIRQLLTDDQRVKFDSRSLGNRRSHHRKRTGRRGG